MSQKYALFFLWMSLLSNPLFAIFEEKDIREAQTRLSDRHPFTYFDLCLSPLEVEGLQKLSITNGANYENFGQLDLLENEINQYLMSIGTNESSLTKSVAHMIHEIVEKVVKGFGSETAWVVLRASTPHQIFDTPRWHTDSYYAPPFEGEQKKVVIALKGPGTLFCNLNPEKREAFAELQEEMILTPFDEVKRQGLDTFLKAAQCEFLFPSLGQGSIFIAGAPYAAIHSEPPIKEPRLFISIFPTTVDQIVKVKHQMAS